MHRFCPFCRLEYEREQGYFLGAMYFGYGMALALSAPLVLVLLIFGGFSVNEVILTLGVTITFLSPLLFRYSRILWMHFDQLWDPRWSRYPFLTDPLEVDGAHVASQRLC